MDALIQFLNARYDAIEAAAKAARYTDADQWCVQQDAHGDYLTIIVQPSYGQVAGWDYAELEQEGLDLADVRPLADHIALHDPAAVLADIAAKRRIVANYERHSPGERGYGAARYAVLCLALPYAAHPDYDESWRPQ